MASEFELDDILRDGERSAFEPKVPHIVGPGSFVFVRTTGVRYAPELLVLELFREIFFDPVSGGISERQLSPDDSEFGNAEKAILQVARGRLKQTQHLGTGGFFAPVYPEQARAAWFRKKSDHALRLHLLQGAMAQAQQDRSEPELRSAAEIIVDAQRGRLRANSLSDVAGKELLSAAVADLKLDLTKFGMRDRDTAVAELVHCFLAVKNGETESSIGAKDPFATRITSDFIGLCEIEGDLPRLLWLDLLKCFLRLSVPAWVLAQMKVSVLLRDWIFEAIERRETPSEDQIRLAVSGRWRGLFHPMRTGTNELALHVERYMKARIELSLLLYLLRSRNSETLFDNSLSLGSPGSKRIPVAELLQLFTKMPIKNASGDRMAVRQSIVRAAESFAAWANPLRKGQGKNIDEFLRSLRRFEPAEADGGYLAERPKAGRSSPGQHVIFPGPTMIRLALLLADLDKTRRHRAIRGKLVLEDLERHFHQYGLEFSVSAGARPHLISELSRLGLLKGSPDAGDYTELLSPIYRGKGAARQNATGNAQ